MTGLVTHRPNLLFSLVIVRSIFYQLDLGVEKFFGVGQVLPEHEIVVIPVPLNI